MKHPQKIIILKTFFLKKKKTKIEKAVSCNGTYSDYFNLRLKTLLALPHQSSYPFGNKSLHENINGINCENTWLLFSSFFELPLCLHFCFIYIFLHVCCPIWDLRQAVVSVVDSWRIYTSEFFEKPISRGLVRVKNAGAGGKIKAINIPIVGSLAMFRSLMRANTHLRSLLHLHSDNQPSSAIDCVNICKMFKILRVLDLRGINSQQDLKIFAVWDIWSWIFLPFPSSLCNLLNLYTLDMLSSFIDCVPVEFWTVHELMPLNSGYITLPPHPGKYCRSLENINFISALTYIPAVVLRIYWEDCPILNISEHIEI